MDERKFWNILASTCRGKWIVPTPEGEDEQTWDEFRWYLPLVNQLKELAPEDMVGFQWLFNQKIKAIYTWDHWGVMVLLTGSQSDNRFTFFRAWVVCMGKDVYEAALRNPDSLADETTKFLGSGIRQTPEMVRGQGHCIVMCVWRRNATYFQSMAPCEGSGPQSR